jgi:tetratricopeptide (TPR) repeat protein
MLAGDVDTAAARWRRSFQCGSRHQQRLIDLLAAKLPAGFFVEHFPLDLGALHRLESQYRRLNRPEELKVLLPLHAQAATSAAEKQSGAVARRAWVEASDVYQQLGDAAAALECLHRAVGCDPSDFDARYALAVRLCNSERLDEAEQHIQWCRQRRPHDESLRSLLDAVVSKRLRTGSRIPPSPAGGRL